MRYLSVAGLLACLATPVLAQDRASAVLVLDGSGSMWGQIAGTAKITIAQGVVDDLLQVIPADQALGLTVYGHRRKGDCTDIETLVAPGIGTQNAISTAVHAIKPKGKTPMTDAVIAAAQSLRYTEEKATVILVSDGIETCNPDPCSAARALEEAGVDFTAHVIGFDVSDPDAVAQMQCLATETGGTFRMASDAKELGTALVEVVAPEPVNITFRATAGQGGAEIGSGLIWSFAPEGTGQQTAPTGTTWLDLLPGDYTVSVLRLDDEATAEAAFTVGEHTATITLVLPELLPAASLEAPETAVAGSEVEVTWSGPGNGNDHIVLATVGSDVNDASGVIDYDYTKDGNPVSLILPTEPGTYELRYVMEGDVDKILASRLITGTAASASLEAPDTAVAGSGIEVTWMGPDNYGDYVSIEVAGSKLGDAIDYAYTNGGNPLSLTLPTEPGTYELRYVANGDVKRILASRPITGTAPTVSLEAPDTAVAGAEIEVTWMGPGNRNDYVSVEVVGSKLGDAIDYAYTSGGNPLTLEMPTEPGTYELRYVADGDVKKILATRPITGTAPTVSLEAPDTAVAGSEIEVYWVGPGNRNDYVSIEVVGSKLGDAIDYAYTNGGNPLTLEMPTEPGTYELRYVANGDVKKILATRPITGTVPTVALEAPETVGAGSEFEVTWMGPDNNRDAITVALVGSKAGDYIDHRYASSGNPAEMTAPVEPGTYILRYVADGDETKVLARRIVKVAGAGAGPLAPGKAALEAAESGAAGGQIAVFWAGPGGQGDMIAVRKIGSSAVETSVAVSSGNPVTLPLPDAAGEYLIHYLTGTGQKSIANTLVSVK